MTLPRWITVGKNPHGGVLHEGVDGRWYANGWAGPLGNFETEALAEQAIKSAPPAPKRKRPPKAEPPEALKDWTNLTDSASGFIVRDERGLAIGGFMPSGGRFAAWAHGKPLGEFDGAGQAENAVLVAHRVSKKRKRP
jgi:hypothetical protein